MPRRCPTDAAPTPHRRPADPLLAQVDALRAAGVTWDAIAAAVGSHRSTLIAWADRRRSQPQRPSLAERLALALPGLAQTAPEQTSASEA